MIWSNDYLLYRLQKVVTIQYIESYDIYFDGHAGFYRVSIGPYCHVMYYRVSIGPYCHVMYYRVSIGRYCHVMYCHIFGVFCIFFTVEKLSS